MPTVSLGRGAFLLAVTASLVVTVAISSAGAQPSGFDDVQPDAFYATPVEELHAQGVFAGTLCEDGFCPSEPIDRKTMAVWVVRILDGEDPQPGASRFSDVNSELPPFWRPFIERLADVGVTSGCGDGANFCPDRNVTRAEMATFIARAFYLPGGPDPGFSDVADDVWYAVDVATIVAARITVGCKDGTVYCPGGDTTRGQMATFLHRALRLGGEDAVVDLDLGVVPVADTSADLRSLELPVFYCGPRESAYTSGRLEELVNWFNGDIKGFYERQSGYAVIGGNTFGTSVTFVSGGNVHPDYGDWDSLTIDSLREEYVDTDELDKCSDEGHTMLGHRRFLILADVESDVDTAAYAYTDITFGTLGPVVMPTIENWIGGTSAYLSAVAHEVGHGFYGWLHPWDMEELDFDPKIMANQLRYEYELESLMSWPTYGRLQDISPGGNAYVSCRQRDRHGWVDLDDIDECAIRARLPDRPILDPVTPGNRSLTVSWKAPPSSGRDEIVDYDVQYRQEGGAWKAWQPERISPATTTTIRGLTNGALYQVQVAGTNRIGTGEWSYALSESPRRVDKSVPVKQVVLTVGDSAQGEEGLDGVCSSVHCGWLHIDNSGFEPGEYTLACAHNGVDEVGASKGVYDSTVVSKWPSTRDCLFGYPGKEVFVIVGAEQRGNTWYGGVYSNVVVWPHAEDPSRELKISWGTNASDRRDCPKDTTCLNLSYEYIGDWPSPSYSVECWGNGQRLTDPFQWSGRPHTGCYYWDGTAQVVINGTRSNTITFPQ